MKYQLNREQFGQTIADAVLASAKSAMPVLVYFDLNEGGFDLTNAPLNHEDFTPILEIDTQKSDEVFPIDDEEQMRLTLEAVSEQASHEMFDEMLPNMIEQITQSLQPPSA